MPYNDYTYMPPSKSKEASGPRVRVNGLINRVLCEGATIAWWWTETSNEAEALALENRLIGKWDPPWNRALRVMGTG